MAAETTGIPPQVIAEWIQYGAAFVVAVVAGLAAAFGWTKNKDVQESSPAVVVSPVVDQNALTKLILTLDRGNATVRELHDLQAMAERRQHESLLDLILEIRQLTKALLAAVQK